MAPTVRKPKTAQHRKGRAKQRGHRQHSQSADGLYLFGFHAVQAALKNPARRVAALYAAPDDAAKLEPLREEVKAQPFSEEIARRLPPGAVHQRVAVAVDPLDQPALPALMELSSPDVMVMLDQVTDPHNVGAIFRSAAAFGAGAVISQERHTPGESGTLARAASGTLEQVPWVRVTNLSRALETIHEAGYWSIGLDGNAEETMENALAGQRKVCLVLGAEGAGLRQNVKSHCSRFARLTIAPSVESLNVSNAAAVALYIAGKGRTP